MNRDPIIGSCVNLISRAKIRYEGILYTIDSTAKTITLSKVRSHGTEDRPSARYAPPRSDVFEYIVFKGSDIEDIYTVDMQESGPGYHDPAILKAGASSIPAAPKLEQSQDAFSKPVQMLVDNLMQNSIWGTVGEVESPPSLQHPKPAMKDPRSAPKDLQGLYGFNAAEQPRRVYPPKVAHETQTSVVIPIVTDSSASASAQAKPKQRQPSPVEDKNNSSVPGRPRSRRGSGMPQRPSRQQNNTRFEGDFDFDSANAQFQKEVVADQVLKQIGDLRLSDTPKVLQRGGLRLPRRKEFALNKETFGQDARQEYRHSQGSFRGQPRHHGHQGREHHYNQPQQYHRDNASSAPKPKPKARQPLDQNQQQWH